MFLYLMCLDGFLEMSESTRHGSLTSGHTFQPLISSAEMGLGIEYPIGGRT